MALDIEYIKSAVRKLAYFDMEYQTFGSWGHAHLFKPVLAEEQLAAWEDLMQLRLPEDYRRYLTCLGNGGAGPAYGIATFALPLNDKLKAASIYSDTHAGDFNAIAREWFDIYNQKKQERYERYCREHHPAPPLSLQEWSKQIAGKRYEELYQKLFVHGQLLIANQGCATDIYLILNGTERGACHCTNSEYDYAYPLTNQQSKQFNLLPEPRPHRAVSWSEYKESLVDFEHYFMPYVVGALEKIDSFTAAQRRQFQHERELVLEFEQLLQEPEKGFLLERMLSKLDPMAFSLKTQSYFLVRLEQLTKEHLSNEVFKRFLAKLKCKSGTNYTYEGVTFAESDASDTDYPDPTFDDFVATFHQSFLES